MKADKVQDNVTDGEKAQMSEMKGGAGHDHLLQPASNGPAPVVLSPEQIDFPAVAQNNH